MTMLQIRLFGPGQLCAVNGQIVHVRARKELAALAYLLLEGRQPQSREVLQALLWADFATESARNNLRVALAHLQALVSPELQTDIAEHAEKLFHTSRTDVQLNPAAQVWVDVIEFQELVKGTYRHDHSRRSDCAPCCQTLQTAAGLYQGEFLAGFALVDSPAFEEWLFLQRERLHLLVSEAYRDLAAYAEAHGDLTGARGYAQRQIELDPLCEPAYRQQMRIWAQQGERSAALAVFERCRSRLHEELGLDPEPETLALHMQILNAAVPLNIPTGQRSIDGQAAPSPLKSAPVLPNHHLPQQITSFIGREQELEQLHTLLQAGTSRLISLVGPGGIGKTRLAIQVASVAQYSFTHGVYFVSFVGVQQVADMPAAIMGALNASFEAGTTSPTQQLLTLLAHQHLLLVIDNLEHLMAGVDLLLAILQAAPRVTLLVTTREQLNCQAEDRFLLHGLTTPRQSDLAHATQTAAVRLFCDRAYRLTKEFKLTPQNCGDVVRICQLVEGMPLAIELVTTWLGELDCAGLAAAIAQNLSILATTQRDRPDRHRSMQAVFDYSWQLLTAREQCTLSRLALCQGRFSPQIATQLTGASLIDLTGLRYKSLLRIAEPGYYDLHPLVRTFALALLDSASQMAAEERLATLYLQQVAAQAVALSGATPQAALQVIEREQDNVQQAWRWAVAQVRIDLLL